MLDVQLVAILASVSGATAAKVVHSVLNSLNRRRVPSRELLARVDGPEDADEVAEVATRVVEQIERNEHRALSDIPADTVRRYAQALLDAEANVRGERLSTDPSRAAKLLEALRKESV